MALGLYICGIGGQGIQLVGKTLALAAVNQGQPVLLSSEYGYTMRGGSSHASMTIGTGTSRALPVLAQADAAIILHQDHLETPLARLRPNGLIVVEQGVANKLPPQPQDRILVSIDAVALSQEAGNPMTAGMVMLAAFCAITGIIENAPLVEAMQMLVPSYREQHIATNRRALQLGHEYTVARHLAFGRLLSEGIGA